MFGIFIGIVVYVWTSIRYVRIITFKHNRWHFLILAPLNVTSFGIIGFIANQVYYKRYWYTTWDYTVKCYEKRDYKAFRRGDPEVIKKTKEIRGKRRSEFLKCFY